MSIPIVLAFPSPFQGHVNPMMVLSQKLVECGCKVIFVNTDFNHKRMVNSMVNEQQNIIDESLIKLVSIPDGLEPGDDRQDLKRVIASTENTMPIEFEKLIEDIHLNANNRISLIVADLNMAWALDIGGKFGIKGAIFWPASAATLASIYSIPKLIEDGIINSDGLMLTTEKKIQLSQGMLKMDTKAFTWLNFGDKISVKDAFEYMKHSARNLNFTEWFLCNTTYELEPDILTTFPKILPIGPLFRSYDNSNATGRSLGQLWEEDLSCLSWLDQQPHQSVTYVAFGSLATFDQNQFNELALGLDLTNRPFLWVVREDNNMTYPYEFQGCKGKVVRWAPQQKVLNHPSIACFVSHCGWISIMEGLSNGVPFLCWPYFADHFYGEAYICDELNVGLGLNSDENGLVSRWEIKKKLDQLVSDENIRSRSLKQKDKVVNNKIDQNRSLNLQKLVKWLKE